MQSGIPAGSAAIDGVAMRLGHASGTHAVRRVCAFFARRGEAYRTMLPVLQNRHRLHEHRALG